MIVALCLQTSMQRGDFPEKRFHDLLVLHAIFDFFSVFQLWWFSCYYSGKVHTYVHEISRNSHLVSRFLKRFQTKNIWIFTLKINKIAALDYNVDFWRENSNIFFWKLLINLETKWEFWRENSNIFPLKIRQCKQINTNFSPYCDFARFFFCCSLVRKMRLLEWFSTPVIFRDKCVKLVVFEVKLSAGN